MENNPFENKYASHGTPKVEGVSKSKLKQIDLIELQQEYREKAEWSKDKPTEQVEDLHYIFSETKKPADDLIVDAGAGFGRNAIYLAEQGYHIQAVEREEGAILDLKNNIIEHNVDNNIEIKNISIQEVLRNEKDSSIAAIIDSGMSHYLTDDELKSDYAKEVLRTLEPGGFFTLLHFSENEKLNPEMTRNQNQLGELFSEKDYEIIREWKEIAWIDKKTGNEHKAWTVTLRKRGGEPISLEQLKRAEFLRKKQKIVDLINTIFDNLGKETASGEEVARVLMENAVIKKRIEDNQKTVDEIEQIKKIPQRSKNEFIDDVLKIIEL